MIPSLPQAVQDELMQLAQRFGQPIVHTAYLPIQGLFDPFTATDRYGEVCMVLRRKNGSLLLMRKIFYPKGDFRLMTGGINFGENIFDALLRETYEETGLTVQVARFLVAAAYHVPSMSDKPLFYTFAFLLDEVSGKLGATDPHEHIEAYREIAASDLPTVAEFLDNVPNSRTDDFNGNWHDWGIFRAVIHRLVWQALQE